MDFDFVADTITPASGTLTISGAVAGTNISGAAAVTGTNTGDQTITLTGNVTGSGTGSFAATIANSAVTYAKIQNVSTNNRLLGRSTAGAGVVEEITVGSGLSLSGGTLTASGGGSGTVTDVSVVTANGVSGSVATSTTTPAITLTLGAITPTSVAATGTVTGSNLSGTNTGDQTITLTGDVTGSGTGSFAATIANGAVTLAKQADIATASFMGRNTAATGVQEVLSIATTKTMLSLTGTNSGDQTITLTGDVTGSGTGSFAATIANSAVTYAKIQNISATNRILGRSTAGAGVVEEITVGGDITQSGSTFTIANSAVTLAKQANIATASFMGRNTAATGVQEVLSIATAKTMLNLTGTNSGDQTITLTGGVTGSGTGSFAATVVTNANLTGHVTSVGNATSLGSFTVAQLNTAISDADVATGGGTATGTNTGDQTITLTGGVTGSGTGSFAATVVTNANLTGPITSVGNATTITNSSVTLAHQANIATASFMGRNTAGTGVQEVLSIATAKTMLDLTGTNSGDQTITLTGDVTGSGTGSFATTLATVTDSGTGTFLKVTRNSKGLITGTTAVVAGDITALVDSTYVNVSGDTMTGTLTFSSGTVTGIAAPSAPSDATTKAYVDNLVTAGTTWRNPIKDPDIQDVVTAKPTLSGSVGQTFTFIKYGGTQGATWNDSGTTVSPNDGDVVQAIITNATGPVADWTQIQAGPLTAGDRYGIAIEHGTVGATLSGVGFRNGDIIQYVSGDPGLFASWSTPDGRPALTVSYAVTAVSTGLGGSFTIAGNHLAEFAIGGTFAITGSTNNNKTFTVTSVSFSTNTTIVVKETVGATADGSITTITTMLQGVTVLVNDPNSYHLSHTYLFNAVTSTWVEVSGPGSVLAGSGLSYSGNTLNVNVDNSTIEINSDILRIKDNGVTNAKLRQSAGLSVVGNSTNSTANVADITAASDYQVMRRSGTSIGFGAIDLSQSAAVTGVLTIPNGGTGQSTFTKGDILVGFNSTTLNKLAVGTDGQMLVADTASTNGVKWSDSVNQAAAIVETFTNDNAGTIVIGAPVYVKSNGNVDLARANAAGTTEVFGLVRDTSIATTASGKVVLSGIVIATTGQWDAVTGGSGGLTPGADYFLDAATAGMLTTTAPSTGGQYVAAIGKALSTTKMKLAVQPTILL